jgi:hypothetical protein
VQKRFHRARVKRVDGEEGRRKIEMAAAQGQETRPPRLRRPVGHDQHTRWLLDRELANDIGEESPGRIQPYDLVPPIERESI